MTAFVHDWNEIKSNLLMLERYRVSSEESLANFYSGLIRRGTCFVVYTSNSKVLFGPSRFLGYANNSRSTHEANPNKDGRETNPVIERILKMRFSENSSLDRHFMRFCHEHDIVPANKKRKFIQTGDSDLSEVDFMLADLEEIQTNKTLTITEKQRLVFARIGQGEYRAQLLRIWHCCPVTGCRTESLLRASHIKPWRACSNSEKLDPYNGIILTPNIDCAFDSGLITFEDDGTLVSSNRLNSGDASKVGIVDGIKIAIHEKNRRYLEYHRDKIFRK